MTHEIPNGNKSDQPETLGHVEEYQITPELLLAHLTSPEFTAAVNRAARSVDQDRVPTEAGFLYMFDAATEETSVVRVEGRNEINAMTIGEEAKRRIVKQLKTGKFPLFEVHTHEPSVEDPLNSYFPSTADLEGLDQLRRISEEDTGIQAFPIGTIIVPYRHRIDVVLYQQTGPPLSNEITTGRYNHELSTLSTFSEIPDLLSLYNFNGAVIRGFPSGTTVEGLAPFSQTVKRRTISAG